MFGPWRGFVDDPVLHAGARLKESGSVDANWHGNITKSRDPDIEEALNPEP